MHALRLDHLGLHLHAEAVVSTQPAIDPLEVAYERGRAEGWAAARAEIGDCWCPVPIRWRLVATGDAIIGPSDGRVWLIAAIAPTPAGRRAVTVERAGQRVGPLEFDPDAQVHILEKVTMLDAMKLTRKQLGAKVEGGRAT